MKKKLLTYGISALVGVVIFIIIICVKQVWAQSETREVMRILSDACLVSGVILGGVGLLVVASNGGAFDMLAYAVRVFFLRFKRDMNNRKYKDFYEYREAKKKEKRSTAYLLIVGLAFVALAVLFLILYYNV